MKIIFDFDGVLTDFNRFIQENNALIQPITLLWIKNSKSKCKVIVNFGKAFQMEGMSIDEGMQRFMEIQKAALEENKVYIKMYCKSE